MNRLRSKVDHLPNLIRFINAFAVERRSGIDFELFVSMIAELLFEESDFQILRKWLIVAQKSKLVETR